MTTQPNRPTENQPTEPCQATPTETTPTDATRAVSLHSGTRRRFLKHSAAAAVGVAATRSPLVHAAQGSDVLRIGLIGCGGRGSGAAVDALHADPRAELVAVGDVFADQTERALGLITKDKEIADRVKVTPETTFTDFDNYRKVIDSGVDVVILATPPHFRPEHLEYVVAQGKHCFVEKPVAVDVPGLKRVQAACEQAKQKGLSIVSGLCYRYHGGVRDIMQKIRDEKAIGDLVAIESSYNAGTLWYRTPKPDWSEMEVQVRNWLYYEWLSGDHICEQAVHSLDKCAWLLGDEHPLEAMALGGRQQRTADKWGDIYDHFTVFYEFPEGRRVYFTCRQQAGTKSRVEERVLGTKGQGLILGQTLLDNQGKKIYKGRASHPSMYRAEHVALFKSIRDNEPINNGHYMCNSTMMAIMGRFAAYTGQTLSWEECMESTTHLGPQEYAWGEAPQGEVPIPGEHKLV